MDDKKTEGARLQLYRIMTIDSGIKHTGCRERRQGERGGCKGENGKDRGRIGGSMYFFASCCSQEI